MSHLLRYLIVAGLLAWSADARAEGRPSSYDGYQNLLADTAWEAMANRDFERSRHFYQLLLVINPDDAYAHRQVGRAALALAQFELAARSFARTDELRGGVPDPELHYLRGEALYAVGRIDEAAAAHRRAARQIGDPAGRMETLWMARILVRRGEFAAAEALYGTLEPLSDEPHDEEVAFSRIEARLLAGDWDGAETLVRGYLRSSPYDQRGRAILAAVLEGRGNIGEEVSLRRELAAENYDPARLTGHGRALERRSDYPGALDRYRAAYALASDPDLAGSIRRLELRTSPELMAAAFLRDDPTGAALEWRAGVAVPVGSRFQLSLTASYEYADRGGSLSLASDSDSAEATATLRLGLGADLAAALRVGGNRRITRLGAGGAVEHGYHLGSGAELRLFSGRVVEAHVRADLNLPWREAASTVREGGAVSGATGRVFVVPMRDRLSFEVGAQARRVSLAPGGMASTSADQLLLFGGVNVTVWSDFIQPAGGEVLDDEMTWPVHMADSITLSYRHYELFTDGSLAPRLVLADRARIDELGGAVRKVVGHGGVVGVEFRGGAGYDWARNLRTWRAGGALLFSPVPRARLTLDYEVAAESTTSGLVGRRRVGGLSLHVDL